MDLIERLSLERNTSLGRLSRFQLTEAASHFSETHRDPARFHVVRNMTIEPLLSLIQSLGRIHGRRYLFSLTSYDDALRENIPEESDASQGFLWIDYRRFVQRGLQTEDILDMIKRTIGRLVKTLPEYPVILNTPWTDGIESNRNQTRQNATALQILEEISMKLRKFQGVLLIELDTLSSQVKFSPLDSRMERINGYPFSEPFSILLARQLALRLLPSREPRLKALILDLDNTLYDGIIGEEGLENLTLYPDLVHFIQGLSDSGVILAINSHNNPNDIQPLFRQYLNREKFVSVHANWEDKASNLGKILKELNLLAKDILVLDDDPVNLHAMYAAFPDAHYVRPSENAEETLEHLQYFPRLAKFNQTTEDSLRTKDLQANSKRKDLREDLDHNQYLKELNTEACIRVNHAEDIPRFADLSMKSNQFNLLLSRISLGTAQSIHAAKDHLILGAKVQDRYAELGLVGIIAFYIHPPKADLVDFLLSCRAFSRNIEDLLFTKALSLLASRAVQHLEIKAIQGPKNRPALDWFFRMQEHLRGPSLSLKGDGLVCTLKLSPSLLESAQRWETKTQQYFAEVKQIHG